MRLNLALLLLPVTLSSFLVSSCGTPSVDRPDNQPPPAKCDPSLQAAIPQEPTETLGAGIVKPAPGSPAADATDKFMNDVAAKLDWARGDLLPRAQKAKDFCDKLDAATPHAH